LWFYLSRVLRKISGPKRGEVTRERGKLHIEELRDLHSSPNIIRGIKLRRLRRVGHVALTEERRAARWLWWTNVKERGRLENVVLDGRITIKRILKNSFVGLGLD
jgi:hypothetical protein